QRIEHPIMPHCNTVVHGDGVKFDAKAAIRINHLFHPLADVKQVNMPWDKLRERVGNSDDRLAKIRILHPGRPPERPRPGHISALCGGATSQLSHWFIPSEL